MSKLDTYIKSFKRLQSRAPTKFEFHNQAYTFIGNIVPPNMSIDLLKFDLESEDPGPLEAIEIPIDALQEFRIWLNTILGEEECQSTSGKIKKRVKKSK